MSLSVFFESPRRSRAVNVLYLIKVCAAVFAFFLLALAPVAHAQQPGGRWVPVPCDANGNPPPSAAYFSDGYFPLYGTQTWTTTSTYFPGTTSAAQTASVFGGIGDGANTGDYPSSACAENSDGLSPLKWWYSTENQYSSTPGKNGYINGTITVKMQGDLYAYYRLEWQSPSSSAPTSPRPDHINLLLRTNLNAYVERDYFSSGLQSGLSATATATDGLPFGETASAGEAGGPGSVIGSHLVRAAVDPATGIAQVSLGGNLRWDATNVVRYGTLDYPVAGYPNYITGQTTNGETRAQASSGIRAGVRPDDREVVITSPMGQTFHKGITGSQDPNKRDSNGVLTDDTIAPAMNTRLSANYYGAAVGPWGAKSAYVWSQAFPTGAGPVRATDDSSTRSGFVDSNGGIAAYKVTYIPTGFVAPQTSNIHLVVKDGVDGATMATDYNVNFHQPYENYNILTDQTQYGPWVRVSIKVESGLGGAFPAPVTTPVSVTVNTDQTGTVAKLLASVYNVTDLNTEYKSLTPRSAAFQMPPNTTCWIEDQTFWRHRTGTVDNYGLSGYLSQISWSLNLAITSVSPLQDYKERLVTDSGAGPQIN